VDVVADVPAHKHQLDFINSEARHPALVAGFGAGKSHAGMMRGFKLKSFPEHVLAIYAPTYSLLRDIWYDKLETYCRGYNIKYDLNKGDKIMRIANFGSIIFRSMDDPAAIIGYEVHDSIVDEIDTIKKAKAKICWDRIIARQRRKRPDGRANTTAAMTTPEGYNFVYDRWKKSPTLSYHLIQASTMDNAEFLPEDYIPSLKESYDPQMLEAYLNGQFVNLLRGRVYYAYNEEQHRLPIDLPIDPTLPLCVCVDFNVNPMAWVVLQFRSRYDIRVLFEHIRPNTSTPDHCISLLKRLPTQTRDMDCIVYGDAAGEHRDTRSTYTDYAIINEHFKAHFRSVQYKVPRSNPPVQTRVLTVNNVLSKENTVKIARGVVELVEDFTQVVFTESGDIDKSDGRRTHSSDAFGYFVAVECPIVHKRVYAQVKSV